MERIITVKGSIENMSRAESMVSSKLRQSYENDLQAMAVSILFSLYIVFYSPRLAFSFYSDIYSDLFFSPCLFLF